MKTAAFSGGYDLQKEPQTKQQQETHRHIVACDFDMELGLPFWVPDGPDGINYTSFMVFVARMFGADIAFYILPSPAAPHFEEQKIEMSSSAAMSTLKFKDFGILRSFRKMNCFVFTARPEITCINIVHEGCD